MKEIVFASSNANKVVEIQGALPTWDVRNLKDIGCTEEIPEEQDTLEGNAQQKAEYVWNKYGLPCFADDTGLEVRALGGRPGVYSARYAGENCSYQDNVDKMLLEMKTEDDRSAQFRTVICLILNASSMYFFDGIAGGEILRSENGIEGFGYDPIFRPKGGDRSFAQMTLSEKNIISHRGKAVKKLAEFLNQGS